MTPTQAIVALNRLTSGIDCRPLASTKGVRADAAAYLAWCAARDLDPERFMRAKHEAIRFRFRVGFRQLIRASDSFIAKFREWGDNRQAEGQSQERIAARTVTEQRTALETTILGESLKAQWGAFPLVCMASPESGGWNPRSSYCNACPIATDCRSNLHPATRAARDAGR